MASIEFDPDDNILVGRVLGIDDLICFHGDSVTEFTQAFHEAVDDYLSACEKLGQAPEKHALGRLMLRVNPSSMPQRSRQPHIPGKVLTDGLSKCCDKQPIRDIHPNEAM